MVRFGAIASGLCSALVCWGQINSINGEVRGGDGRPLPNTVIRIERTDIAEHFRTTTDNSGHYTFAGLPIGDYEVILEVNGKDERSRSIRLPFSEHRTLDFSLERYPLGPRERKLQTALRDLENPDRSQAERALKAILSMADHKQSAAMYVVGKWSEEGYLVPKDVDKGLALISKAAEQNNGAALYEMGRRYLAGDRVLKDEAKGLRFIRRGAIVGSVQAQYYLGASYELGGPFPQDDAQARQYFRMCAMQGEGACGYRLALLLLKRQPLTERDYLQALAWAAIAAEQGVEGAAGLWKREEPRLTAKQAQWVAQIKEQYSRGN